MENTYHKEMISAQNEVERLTKENDKLTDEIKKLKAKLNDFVEEINELTENLDDDIMFSAKHKGENYYEDLLP